VVRLHRLVGFPLGAIGHLGHQLDDIENRLRDLAARIDAQLEAAWKEEFGTAPSPAGEPGKPDPGDPDRPDVTDDGFTP
jgi:hypothetical protein